LLFFIYLVLAVLLFVDRRQHKDEVEEMANALVEQREREEELKRQKAADEAAEYQALCQEIGEEAGLTKREVEVLALLARGRDLPYICEELYLARNTVKGYTKSIYAKLGVHSKQELIDLVDARVG
jgi:DNA-binding NarL/FixJ family response regulator